jgi:hypothetical protein
MSQLRSRFKSFATLCVLPFFRSLDNITTVFNLLTLIVKIKKPNYLLTIGPNIFSESVLLF